MASSSGTAQLGGPPVPESEPASQLLVDATSPFTILHASPAWCRLTGYTAAMAVGRPIAFLHGPLTCSETLTALGVAMQYGKPLRVMLVSYTANGEPYLNCVDSR